MDFTNLTEDEIVKSWFKKKKKKNQKKAIKAAEKRKLVSFKNRTNTSIYVKGLPQDISVDEMKDFFLKAGILKIDPETNQEKIKIYTDDHDRSKVRLGIRLESNYRAMRLSCTPWRRASRSRSTCSTKERSGLASSWASSRPNSPRRTRITSSPN